MAVDADLDPVLADDADVAVLHLKLAADKDLRHPSLTPYMPLMACGYSSPWAPDC